MPHAHHWHPFQEHGVEGAGEGEEVRRANGAAAELVESEAAHAPPKHGPGHSHAAALYNYNHEKCCGGEEEFFFF